MNKIKNNVFINNKSGELYFSPTEKRDHCTGNKIISSGNNKGN